MDSALLNKEAHAILIKKKKKFTKIYFSIYLGYNPRHIIAVSTYPLCLYWFCTSDKMERAGNPILISVSSPRHTYWGTKRCSSHWKWWWNGERIYSWVIRTVAQRDLRQLQTSSQTLRKSALIPPASAIVRVQLFYLNSQGWEIGVHTSKEASCCIQRFSLVYEERTTCYFFHNTIKPHSQLFLQVFSQIHCADGSIVI